MMRIRWRELGIAFVLAVGLWYGLSGAEKMELPVEVRVEYRGLPQGLTIRDGVVNKLTVRVSASPIRSRSLYANDYTYTVDLSSVKKGDNSLPVIKDELPFWGGIEVVDVSPSTIDLTVDSIASKQVPVIVNLQGQLQNDVSVRTEVVPPEVVIEGASSVLAAYQEMHLPLLVDDTLAEGTVEMKRALIAPAGLRVTPEEVTLTLHVSVDKREVNFKKMVQVDDQLPAGVVTTPRSVALTLRVPASLAGRIASNKDVAVTVSPDVVVSGDYTLPVNISLPLYSELVKVDPPTVILTIPIVAEKNGQTEE